MGILRHHGLYRYTPDRAFYIMIDVSGLVRVSLANSEENIETAMEPICRFVRRVMGDND